MVHEEQLCCKKEFVFMSNEVHVFMANALGEKD